MTGCSVDVTVVTVVAAVWAGVPQPDGTTAIAATAGPRVRMKWEARRRVRHPEQISQSVFHKTIESSTNHPRSRHRHPWSGSNKVRQWLRCAAFGCWLRQPAMNVPPSIKYSTS
jgi:hypothetical protein